MCKYWLVNACTDICAKNIKVSSFTGGSFLFEKTPPSEWQQRSEGLLGGASSSIEEETTEDEALELFLTHLRALKILTDDTPEDT
jgi:hypothetical protein